MSDKQIEQVKNAIKDSARGACYYDRKDGAELNVKDFEKAFQEGYITRTEAGEIFAKKELL